MKQTTLLLWLTLPLLAIIARAEVAVITGLVESDDAALNDEPSPPPRRALDEDAHGHLRQRREAVAKIIGGVDAEPGNFSYFVQGKGCGGTLIASDVVLTAAHCTTPMWKAWGRTAVIGSNTRGNLSISGERIEILDTVRHPLFDSKSHHYDFQVVILAQPVSLNQTIVTLNRDSNRPQADAPLTVAGFGVKHNTSLAMSNTLRTARVMAVDDDLCKTIYADSADYVLDTTSQLCAAMKRKGPCYGDSGGPLIDRRGYQVGIVSTGITCGDPNYPYIYARVSAAMDWIDNMVCKYSQSPPIGNCRRLREKRQQARRTLGLRGGARDAASDVAPPAPSEPSECKDMIYPFSFGDTIRSKDCAWLKDHPVLDGEALCDYDHIAYRCPATCGAC